jgi:serine protease Do/serine protease DegQ
MKIRQLIAVSLFTCLVTIAPALSDAPVLGDGGAATPTLAPFLKRIAPAVVNISATAGTGGIAGAADDPLMQFLFGLPNASALAQRSTGSGVIIDAKTGLIVTNHHLIVGAGRIVVTLKDRHAYEATLVGSDPGIDLALLRIGAGNLVALPLGDSDKLEVGDYIVAIGNPFGLGQTASTGIVSALGLTEVGIEDYEDFIQTDAPMNPGNSGGALVNLRGELVGINTAIMSVAGGNVGIAFAIPINMARFSVEQILKHGEVRRGWLGVRIQDLTPNIAAVMGISATQGAIVNQLHPDGPAKQAGIQPGDVIVSVNGKAVRDAGQFRNVIGMTPIGEIVRATVLREGAPIGLSMRVEKLPEGPTPSGVEGQGPLAGARFDAIPPASPLYGKEKGVMVIGIAVQARLFRAGLRPGDVIVAVNNRSIGTVEELNAIATGTGPWTLNVKRDGADLFLVLQ